MLRAIVLAVLTLALAACNGAQPTPTIPGHDSPPPTTPTPTLTPQPTPTAGLTYLVEEIPPCTPVHGSAVDPCEPDVEPAPIFSGFGGSKPELGDEPESIQSIMASSNRPSLTPYVVLRGTYLPNTVRCASGNPYRPPSHLTYEQYDYVENSFSIKCYADVQVGAYVLGEGPSKLSVQVFFYPYWDGEFSGYAEEDNITEQELIERLTQILESSEAVGSIAGREQMLFLTPATSTSVEVWEAKPYTVWDVQRREGEAAIAVHPDRDLWRRLQPSGYYTHRSSLEMELSAFKQAVTAAHEARIAANGGRTASGSQYPMIVTDANKLRQAMTDIGAYNHPDGPPAQPPSKLTCDGAAAVAVPNAGRGLVHDCEALLKAKAHLGGSLNWSIATSIDSWDGVTLADRPFSYDPAVKVARVTQLRLPSKGLGGMLPAALGSLFDLAVLDLSNSALTGSIPAELGRLRRLTELRLSGNTLTGCIPVALKDVTTHDLASLNLLYCAPPAPGSLSAGPATATSVPLTWGAVSSASKYRVEHVSYRRRLSRVDGRRWTGWEGQRRVRDASAALRAGARCSAQHDNGGRRAPHDNGARLVV